MVPHLHDLASILIPLVKFMALFNVFFALKITRISKFTKGSKGEREAEDNIEKDG